MNMKPGNGFAGLPSDLVSELLASAGGIAEELAAPLKSLFNDRENIRKLLSGRSLMGSGINPDDAATADKTVCGIDIFSGSVPTSGSSITGSAACAVEGLPSGKDKSHWNAPRHAVVLRAEKPEDNTEQLLHALACELACELALSAPHDIILYNMSPMRFFQSVMESLIPAMNAKQYPSGMEFLKRLKGSLTAFGRMFMAGNGNSLHAGVLNSSHKKELSDALGLSLPVADTMIMTALLEPGEATSPVPISSEELGKTAALPVKDEQFSAIRGRIIAAIRTCSVIYYRPYAWTPAFRIEIPGSAAENHATVSSLLAAIRQQCSFPGSRQPFPLKQAENLAGTIADALSTFRDHTASIVMKQFSDIQDFDTIVSFMVDYDNNIPYSERPTEELTE